LGHNPDAELTGQIEGFTKEMLLPTLTAIMLPSIQTKGIAALADEFMAHLNPTTDAAAVRAKVERYLHCFYDTLLQ
jgi:hypothetical protein